MTIAIAIMMAIVANAQPARTQQFSTVKVNAPVRLTIVNGPSYSVNVRSANSELAQAVTWSVENGQLNLNALDLQSLENSDDEVRVIVTAPGNVNYEIGGGMEKVSSWEKSLPTRHRFPRFHGHPMKH